MAQQGSELPVNSSPSDTTTPTNANTPDMPDPALRDAAAVSPQETAICTQAPTITPRPESTVQGGVSSQNETDAIAEGIQTRVTLHAATPSSTTGEQPTMQSGSEATVTTVGNQPLERSGSEATAVQTGNAMQSPTSKSTATRRYPQFQPNAMQSPTSQSTTTRRYPQFQPTRCRLLPLQPVTSSNPANASSSPQQPGTSSNPANASSSPQMASTTGDHPAQPIQSTSTAADQQAQPAPTTATAGDQPLHSAPNAANLRDDSVQLAAPTSAAPNTSNVAADRRLPTEQTETELAASVQALPPVPRTPRRTAPFGTTQPQGYRTGSEANHGSYHTNHPGRPTVSQSIAGSYRANAPAAGPSNQASTPHLDSSINPAAYGTNAGVVAYAIAENFAAENHLRTGATPTFTSPWASINHDQLRTLSDRGRFKRARYVGLSLDTRRLSGRHDWCTVQSGMRFHHYTQNPQVFGRRDMQRIRMVEHNRDKMSANDVWSMMRQARDWYEIPHTLKCDRTFARDDLEAYYLDRMDFALNVTPPSSTRDLPLLQDLLCPRRWTVFGYRGDFMRESWYRVRLNVLAPFDDMEVQNWDPSAIKEEFSEVPRDIVRLEIPAAMPIPTPPTAFYFHHELRHGDKTSLRHRRLSWIRDHEYNCLAIAIWYNEMAHGDRMFILKPHTQDYLRHHYSDIKVVENMTTPEIFNRMATAAGVRKDSWNKLVFKDKEMPSSFFVDSRLCKVVSDIDEIGGRLCEARTTSRRIYDALRLTRRTELRNSRTLRLHIYQNEINLVQGLSTIVHEQGWAPDGNISVVKLLQNLSGTVELQKDKIETLRSQAHQQQQGQQCSIMRDPRKQGKHPQPQEGPRTCVSVSRDARLV